MVEQRVREEREKMSKELSELAMIKRKLKKEEENRRIFGEVAKKREEELKKLQADYHQLLNEGKTTDEQQKRDRIVAMQRKDNKIEVLERKVKELQRVVEAHEQAKEEPEKKPVKRAKPRRVATERAPGDVLPSK